MFNPGIAECLKNKTTLIKSFCGPLPRLRANDNRIAWSDYYNIAEVKST